MLKSKFTFGIVVLVSILFTSCGDSSTTPDYGMLSIQTNTLGANLDMDGYYITIDDGDSTSIDVSATIPLKEISTGEHQVKLSGLANNCLVDGDNPKSLSVSTNGSTTATFNVSCKKQLKGKIVYMGLPDNGDHNLYAMNTDGTGSIAITNDAKVERYPAISPSGTRIAYATGTESTDHELHLINIDGSDAQVLTSTSSGSKNNYDHASSWSPDGTKIVFNSSQDGDPDIFMIDSSGSNTMKVVNSDSADYISTSAWSDDGSKIVF